jgi:hypothetical protein
MSIELLSFILGGSLVAIGLLGGGIEVRELKIPAVGWMPRLFSFVAGLAFVGLAVFLGPHPPLEPAEGAHAAVAMIERETFPHPMFGDLRLDACYEWGTRCGEEAATAWCQKKGYKHAVDYPIENVGDRGIATKLIGTQVECKEQFCASFAHITCER